MNKEITKEDIGSMYTISNGEKSYEIKLIEVHQDQYIFTKPKGGGTTTIFMRKEFLKNGKFILEKK